jgi:hypothetical protein
MERVDDTPYERLTALQHTPLCLAISAVVLGDGLRGGEVREEVEKELDKGLGRIDG